MRRLARRMGLYGLLAAAFAWPGPAEARIVLFGDGDDRGLEISGELFNYTELRFDGPKPGRAYKLWANDGSVLDGRNFSNQDEYDNLNAMRTELLIEMTYRGIPHVTPVLRLRPYYDAMFAIEDKSYSNLGKYWSTNMNDGLNDDWDPLIREAFVDFNYHPFFVRAGRQIVTWGRSDGVVVLDQVTPRNFRNPLTFEQERFMIPQWMINATMDFSSYDWMPGGTQKELQLIWNLEYLPSRFPGFTPKEEGQHPWTLNVVDFADQVINTSDVLFASDDFFDNDAYKDGDWWHNTEFFARWRATVGEGFGPISDFTYSFHYGYLYNDIPFYELQDRIDAGFAINIAGPRAAGGGIDFNKYRYHMVGASMDKALLFLPGQLEGTVLRGEVAYNIGDRFYEPDLGLRRADNITYLIGLDQYLYLTPRSWVETPWFVSFQFWQDWILRKPGRGKATNLDSVACELQPGCGDRGYIIGGEWNLFNGLRDQHRSIVTLYMFNDFLPGKTLRVEIFGLHEFEQKGSWLRFVLGYNFTNNFSGRVGTNILFGDNDAFIGQFKGNDVVFTELKLTF